jgi:hypothetical protein
MAHLHVVDRSHGGENAKDRPRFYSKLLTLASLVRAAEEAGRPIELVSSTTGRSRESGWT